jgi:hypothetical protein
MVQRSIHRRSPSIVRLRPPAPYRGSRRGRRRLARAIASPVEAVPRLGVRRSGARRASRCIGRYQVPSRTNPRRSRRVEDLAASRWAGTASPGGCPMARWTAPLASMPDRRPGEDPLSSSHQIPSPAHLTCGGQPHEPAAPDHLAGLATVRLASRRGRCPRRSPCPCSTEPRPVGRLPRSGRVEIRLGPAWVRYRGTATPETDPPSTFHRPVLVPGRHRARASRLRVTYPRCRSCPWCPSATTPTSPTYPARVRPLLLDPWPSVAAVQARPGACSGIPRPALHRPAVLHRVAE